MAGLVYFFNFFFYLPFLSGLLPALSIESLEFEEKKKCYSLCFSAASEDLIPLS
jgi:hypothetical protein